MNKEMKKFVIDTKIINDDMFGKQGAQYELGENQTELLISIGKIAWMFSMFFLPTLLVWGFVTIISLIFAGGIYIGTIAAYVILGIFSLFVSLFATSETFFDDEKKYGKIIKESSYKIQKQRVSELWERRKQLKRYVNVEAELYENSQAREIAPLLLARVRKHNKMIEDGGRLISLQETLDKNSDTKLAPKLAENIIDKVKKEYRDLQSRMESYDIMREMRSDTSLEVTAALMSIEDLNKSDLDDFLAEKQDGMKLLLDDNEGSDLPVA